MRVKTSELTGAALDWAVATCEGFPVGVMSAAEQASSFRARNPAATPQESEAVESICAGFTGALCKVHADGYRSTVDARGWRFATDWAQGGPIIDRELIETSPAAGAWRASPNRDGIPDRAAPLVLRPHPSHRRHALLRGVQAGLRGRRAGGAAAMTRIRLLAIHGDLPPEAFCDCEEPIDNDHGLCMCCGRWINYRDRS